MCVSGFRLKTERLPLIAITADCIKAKDKVHRIHQELHHYLIFAFVQVVRLSVCIQQLARFPFRPLLKQWSEYGMFDFPYPVTILPLLRPSRL